MTRSGDCYLVRFSDCPHFTNLEMDASGSFACEVTLLLSGRRGSWGPADIMTIFKTWECDECSGHSGQPSQHSRSRDSNKTRQNDNKSHKNNPKVLLKMNTFFFVNEEVWQREVLTLYFLAQIDEFIIRLWPKYSNQRLEKILSDTSKVASTWLSVWDQISV